MTIKKRLFISNILMIVIPIILALVTMAVAYIMVDIVFRGSLREVLRRAELLQGEEFEESLETQWTQILIIAVLSVAGVFAVTYFTNRFLIKLVFQKIEQPLTMLSQGVHQIKNGNLDYRIEYYTQDEFQPICANFNEIAGRLKNSVE